MAKKGDKSEKATTTSGDKPVPKSAPTSAPKNPGKNGAGRAKATEHVAATGEVAAPGPPAPPTERLGRAEAGRSVSATSPTPARGNTVTDEVTHALLLPVHVAQRVLPTRRVPVYAGAAALALIGVIEWPVALGAGLAWEALRRWGPDRSER